jgi:phosphohistidine swiveling domain-containing protein
LATLRIKSYGAKAHFLSRLQALQVRVPEFVALPRTRPLPDARRLGRLLAENLSSASTDGEHYRLAIRSSAADEDLRTGSMAGSYLTRIGDFSVEEATEAVAEVRARASVGNAMGVIVQRFVEPSTSGVVLSLDPMTFERRAWAIAWVDGRGEPLVSGAEPGHSAVLRHSSEVPSGWLAGGDDLASILRTSRVVEAAFGFPVDIEWVVDGHGVWFVQARPVVLPSSGTIPLVAGQFDRLPVAIRYHPKVAIREAATASGIPMSRAVVELWSESGNTPDPSLNLDASSRLSVVEGVSVVLLHPRLIDDKVVREFAPVDATNVDFWTRECRRYSVRRYPTFSDIRTTTANVLDRGLKRSWLSAAIVQEIHGAHATGILRRSPDGYVVELARGHFVPKGFVTTSRFQIDPAFHVVESERLEQTVIYHFVNGHVVTESPAEQQLALTDAQVGSAVKQLAPMFEKYPDAAIEFGILTSGSRIVAYLIDAAEADVAGIETPMSLLASGVISGGTARGSVLRVPQVGDGGEQHFDAHLAEVFSSADPITGVVLVAHRASIDLLPLVHRANSNCAFVFRSASALAHLAVVMRERRVPAVVVGPQLHAALADGDVVTIDAVSVGLSPDERVRALGRGD